MRAKESLNLFCTIFLITLISSCATTGTTNTSSQNPYISSNSFYVGNTDFDADKDGLSDFQEKYKYFTDPNKPDSDNDGIPDNDWNERREYTYTIRNIMEILKPVSLDAMNSDYQDAELIEEKEKTVVVEIIYYPLNEIEKGISENRNWKSKYSSMTDYLSSTKTSDWDPAMRQELLQALASDSIYPEKLADRQVVRKVSDWICNFAGRIPFVAFFVDLQDDEVIIPSEYEELIYSFNRDYNFTNLFDDVRRAVSGKEMFRSRSMGSCTPTAILQTSVFRALGIPSRLAIGVPLIDANDEAQWEMMQKVITNQSVLNILNTGLEKIKGSWASHTYNEVFIGNRWVSLSYNDLGHNPLDQYCNGLLTQVNIMTDWIDSGITKTWTERVLNFSRRKNDSGILSSINQYMSLELSEQYPLY